MNEEKKENWEGVSKLNIPKQYMIPLQGEMNKGVYDCFQCNFEPTHRKSKFGVTEDILGFANSNIGKMVVWECKGCGQKYYFHLRENDLPYIQAHDKVITYHEYVTTGKWEYR